MRLSMHVLLVPMVVGSLLIATPTTTGASVPDKPFTQTQCESYSDSVARLYTAGLGREPEQGGFDFWITEYTQGNWSFPQMAQAFVDSAEFQSLYGPLGQDEFIRQLYRNVLGREGEAGGVTFWNEQMSAGMDRATVLMRFAESPENITNSGTAEPDLGPFNEGREGYWRCGPSLDDTLLSLADFPESWEQNESTGRAPVDAGCSSALRMPDDLDEADFIFGSSWRLLGQGTYIAPTTYGAEQYMAKVRQALIDCSAFSSVFGPEVTFSPLSMGSYGDDTAAVRITDTYSDEFVSVADFVVVRHGTVVTTIYHQDEYSIDSVFTEDIVAIASSKLEAAMVGQ